MTLAIIETSKRGGSKVKFVDEFDLAKAQEEIKII